MKVLLLSALLAVATASAVDSPHVLSPKLKYGVVSFTNEYHDSVEDGAVLKVQCGYPVDLVGMPCLVWEGWGWGTRAST